MGRSTKDCVISVTVFITCSIDVILLILTYLGVASLLYSQLVRRPYPPLCALGGQQHRLDGR